MKPLSTIALVLSFVALALPVFAQTSGSTSTPSPQTIVTPTTSGQTVTTTTQGTSDAAKPKDDKKE
jgi:hypothetical protein